MRSATSYRKDCAELNPEDACMLDDLLGESAQAAKIRESTFLERELRDCDGLILFGCGHLGQKLARILCRDKRPVLAFADNARDKWGTHMAGLPVLSPEEAASRYGTRAAFIVTIWAPHHRFLDTWRQLSSLGCRRVIPFMPVLWANPEALPHYQFERPSVLLKQKSAIRQAFQLWADEISRQQYLAHLRWRLHMDFEGLPVPSPEDQYFVEGLLPERSDALFIDGGAFDGDTLRRMLALRGDRFGHYIALEPDPRNFARLHSYWETLPGPVKKRIELMPAALSDTDGAAAFDAAGATRAALSSSGDMLVQTIAIDSLWAMDRPCCIKMDLEGAERQALEGAGSSIRRAAPDLAICVYHRPGDLWDFPLLLKAWQPDYRFYLRSHDEDGLELVLYATREGS